MKNITVCVFLGNKWSALISVWYIPPPWRILWWGFWASVCDSCLIWILPAKFPPPHPVGQRSSSSWSGTPLWGHARSHISGLTPFSPACVSLVPVGSVLSFPLPPVSFHTQHSFEKAKPYTDTETVYLGRVSIIYAVQLFALSHLCLSPPPNLTYFLESRCLTAWLFIQILN